MELTTLNIENMVTLTDAIINFDNSHLIELASEQVKKYKDLIVTDDIVADIKKEVADLNKIVKNLDDERKKVKNKYNTPLIKFELQVANVTSILNNAIKNLKQQINVFDEEKRNEKLVKVKTLIEEELKNSGLVEKYANQVAIKDKYLNISESFVKIKDDVQYQIQQLLMSQQIELDNAKLAKELEQQKQLELEEKINQKNKLINALNAQYGFNFTYENLRTISLDELIKYYVAHDNKLKASKAEVKPEPVTQEVTKPQIKANEFLVKFTGLDKDKMQHVINKIIAHYAGVTATIIE